MNKLVILGLFLATAMAVPMPETSGSNLDCLDLDDGLFSCLFIKANSALARAARSSDLQLIDGVTFVRDTPLERTGRAMKSETELMNELPRESSERALKLMSMIYDSAVSFLKSHSLKINVPEQSLARALSEGRGKMKKMILPLIAAAGVKLFALIPILFGGLSLLVLKAIVVSKIALIIAGVLAFQRLFSGHSSSNFGAVTGALKQNIQPAASAWYDAPAQGWSAGPAGQQTQQGYYKRSFDDVKAAQNLAYSAHAPTESD